MEDIEIFEGKTHTDTPRTCTTVERLDFSLELNLKPLTFHIDVTIIPA